VCPIVLEAAGENLSRFGLQSHQVEIERGGQRQESPHPQRRIRAAVAGGRTEVRGLRGPAEALVGGVEVQVCEAIEAYLHRVSDDTAGHELPESDRAADRRELRPAMAAVGPAAVEV